MPATFTAEPVEVTIRLPNGITRRPLAAHPLALLIPGMTPDDFARLRTDVLARGIHEPLLLFEGQVLDGRHRLMIAGMTGQPVTVRQFSGDALAARNYVWSVNVARRHLTIPQLALAADRFGYIREAKEKEAGPRDPDRRNGSRWPQIASRALGGTVTPRALERFTLGRVAEAPQTTAKVEAGTIRRVDTAVKAAAAELAAAEGRPVQIPPPVPRTPWDRLGCARGDVLAAEQSVLDGRELDPAAFAGRAREIQGALIRIERLLSRGY